MCVFHTSPFVGVSRPRSWIHFLVSVGRYRQKLINLVKIDFWNTPPEGPGVETLVDTLVGILARGERETTPGPANPIPDPYLEPLTRTWSHLWAFIAKSYQNLQKLTFD